MIPSRQQKYLAISTFSTGLLRSSHQQYANDRSVLTFGCKTCDSMVLASAYDYYNGKTLCESCQDHQNRQMTESEKTIQNIQDLAKPIHGNYYQYLQIIDDSVAVKCPKHGMFTISISAHVHDGIGCNHCKLEDSTNRVVSNKDKFIEQANAAHQFSYRYDRIQYENDDTVINVRCPKHGSFGVTPKQHLSGVGCTICMKKAKVVNEIVWDLKSHNIVHSLEKTFANCVSVAGKALHFDIFIPEKNLCVEFDNPHHFEPTRYSDDVDDNTMLEYFRIQQQNDAIKDQYCQDHHINFVRISYTTLFPSAVLLKYMSSLSDQRMIYTWMDFEKDITNIITYIKTFNYEKFAVYGVSRGGVPYAVHVSNHFEQMCEYGCVSFQRYDGNSKEVQLVQQHDTVGLPIFVIDDLISSGSTMKKVVQSLTYHNPTSTIHPIVIFGTANDDGVQYMNVHPLKWIVFPYEV